MKVLVHTLLVTLAIIVYVAFTGTGIYATTVMPAPQSLLMSIRIAFVGSIVLVTVTLVQEIMKYGISQAGLLAWFLHGVMAYYLLFKLAGNDLFGMVRG
jgi:hypothetical protein